MTTGAAHGMSPLHPLAGKTALVTGVSRRRGIGFAIATRLARDGANIAIHHFAPHDDRQPWGADDLDAVRDGVRADLVGDAVFADIAADLSDPANVSVVFEVAAALTGGVDIVVCNHARSGDDGSIVDMTAERLDAHWDVNARATILLTAEFARSKAPSEHSQRRPGERVTGGHFTQPQGHVFWLTSGQLHTPMLGEVAYATSKAALAGITATVAAELLELGIVLNTINPGPVNTGYLDADTTDRPLDELQRIVDATPFGRWGAPTDPAELIAWLASPAGSWVVGQVITSDGGFSLR